MQQRPELELIEAFVTFVESRNINEAAKKLHVSQPAVSLKLKRLEEQLGRSLFEFSGTKKVLGPFGRGFYEAVSPGLHGLNRTFQEYSGEWEERMILRVGGRRELLQDLASVADFPGVLAFRSMRSDEALDALLRQEVDVAIAYKRPKTKRVKARKWFTESVSAIVPKKMIDRSMESHLRDLDFLTSQPYIAYREPPPYFKDWARGLGDEWLTPRIKMLIEDWRVVVKMVNQGRGFAFVPTGYADDKSIDARKVDVWKFSPRLMPHQSFFLLYNEDIQPTMDRLTLA